MSAPLVMPGKATSTFSPCDRFRYALERNALDQSAGIRTLTVVMVNPSTASGSSDDPTLRKVQGFALRNNYNRVLVGNLFAFRSTDIKGLATVEDPRGDRANLEELARMMLAADGLLFAWGPVAKVPRQWRGRWRTIAMMAERAGKQPLCLGTSSDGHPRHPLMVAYSQPLIPWIAPK